MHLKHGDGEELLFMDKKMDPRKKWREDHKCIWNMVLEKNVKNKMER